MTSEIVHKAQFNPKIKTYYFTYIALFTFVTVVFIPFTIIWFLGLGTYISRRYYEGLSCQLTTRHLEFKKGIMFKVERTIPLDNIQDLTFIDNPILRWFDLRILKIETAGHSGNAGSDMTLVGIIDSADFKTKVLQQRDKIQSQPQITADSNQIDNGEVVGILKEIKEVLVQIRDKKS